MGSDGIVGVGTLFKRGGTEDSSSQSFTTIAEVNSISWGGMSRAIIDFTNLNSTGGYREFKGGFRDAGELTLNMNFTRDGYDQMKDDFESDDLRYYQIVLPDDGQTTFEFLGLVTAIPFDIPTDDKITVSVTIKVSGQVTMSS